jgi:DNA-binding transcriptional ArsR family regulator
MALAKKTDFSAVDLMLSDWCKALSHPARIVILRTLAAKGECICGELVLDLPLAQSTVSQHIKALKEVGLIQGEIDGPRSKYCVNRKNLDRFIKVFGDFGFKIREKTNEKSLEKKGTRK